MSRFLSECPPSGRLTHHSLLVDLNHLIPCMDPLGLICRRLGDSLDILLGGKLAEATWLRSSSTLTFSVVPVMT